MNDFNPDTFEQRNLPFIINRLSPTIGGEILGVDLSETLEEETKALIYEALLAVSYTHLTLPTKRIV